MKNDPYVLRVEAILRCGQIAGKLHSAIMRLMAKDYNTEQEVYSEIIRLISEARADILDKSMRATKHE